MSRLRRACALLAGAAVAVGALTLPVPAATAAEVDRACTDVEAVWARGSGQGLDGREFTKFRDELTDRIAAPTTFDVYELGTEAQDGYQYPAVAVGTGGWDQISNTIGASAGSGLAFEYGNSVWEGAHELVAYLGQRMVTCGETVFVLGGYSQGAQVIGQTYQYLTDTFRERIVFNALFGDPKLHLPEGEGIWPAACRGAGSNSEWRRDVPDCRTDNGSLGARKPYLPAGWTSSSGLWCEDDDFVCGSAKAPWTTSGHMVYGDDGGAIEDAAREIAERLKTRLPDRAPTFDAGIHLIGAGTTGLDVMFVLDSTGSMSGQIDAAKRFAASMAGTIAAARGRIALVEYRDAGDEFVAVTRIGLTSDVAAFQAALDPIVADGGGDSPEALLAALMEGFNTLEWRNGATKAAIILTDETYHDPDIATGWTTADVVRRSLEIDPVNLYPVVPEWAAASYEALASQTAGKVVVDGGDTEAALTDTLTELKNRPVVLLPVLRYAAPLGEAITFDASASYVIGSEITEYAWDVDGDGTFDRTTTEPVLTHTYPGEFDGLMQVRVTAANGTVGSMSAPVLVSATAPDDGRPAAPATVEVSATDPVDGVSDVTVTWTPGDDRAARWGIAVNGIGVAYRPAGDRSIVLTGVERAEDVEVTVHGLDASGQLGQGRSAYVPAAVEPEPTPTPTPTPTPEPTDPGTPAPTPDPTTPAPTTPAPPAPGTPSTPVTPASPAPTLTLSATRVRAGGEIDVTASGLPAAAPARIELHSDPVLLAARTTTAAGTLQTRVTIPRSTRPGVHTVVVRTSAGDVSAQVTVLRADGGALAATGATPGPWVAAGLLALAAGGLLVGVRRAAVRRA
ncbi:cutinase family protein [Cellulomonas sp. 179-A 9B4 NHS]|uniref:cutinase family protein n=1 Tax=Cellulomonas sp. 179-A 9B4 NHS TaxID=3142379 RepID=UPI00399FE08A